VRIPQQYGTSASSALDEDIGSGVRVAAPIHLNPFTQNYYITLNGKDIVLKSGISEIEVVFPDGSKVKLRFVIAQSTISWVVISRTDASGNPISGPSSGGSGGGAGTPGQPAPPNPQPNPNFYCPVQVTHDACIVDVTYTGADCPTSGQVEIILRPCGS
jgi:hypothetical protein